MPLVCFDFWNTLVYERTPRALLDARISAIVPLLDAAGFRRSAKEVENAHTIAQSTFERSWDDGKQFGYGDAATLMQQELALPSSARRIVADGFLRGGASADVALVEGAAETVAFAKRAGAIVALVCDVGLTPSSILKSWLQHFGLSRHFDALAFSDESGHYKPSPEAFFALREQVTLPPELDGVHVGDRRRTDVAGARNVGLEPIRFSGVFDDQGLDDADEIAPDMNAVREMISNWIRKSVA